MQPRHPMLYQRGPETRPRATYNKTGIGQHKQVRNNPVSWGFDCIGNCWPFLSLRGGQDQASQAIREETALGLKPKQNVLKSRGIIGIIEEAWGSGGVAQSYSGSTAPENGETTPASGSTSGNGSTTPTEETQEGPAACPAGQFRVWLGNRWSDCKVAFGY